MSPAPLPPRANHGGMTVSLVRAVLKACPWHPSTTHPLYGALLLVDVWWAGAAVTDNAAQPDRGQVVVLVVALPVGLVEFGMTFHDPS